MNDAPMSARRRRAPAPARRRFSLSPDAVKGPLAVVGGLLILAGIGYYLIFAGFDTAARVLTAAGILLVGVAVAIDPEAVWGKLTTRNFLYSGNTLLLAAVFIGILVLVNVLGARRTERWDLTAGKAFSLSDETIQVLQQIQQPVQAVAFFEPTDTRRRDIEDRLYEYQVRAPSGMFSYQIVDPFEVPGLVQQLGVRELGTTVFIQGDRRQLVTGTREADLTTGLIKLVQPNPRKAYFTTGHQEHRIDGFDQDSYGQIKTQLESRNFVVETLNLFTTPEVPADASVVVIAGPKAPFSEAEVQALSAYVDRGGDLMILVDPAVDTGLGPLLSRWSIEVGRTYVVESDPRLVAARSPFLPVVERFGSHKITERLGLPVVFVIPTYLTAPRDPIQGWRVTTLAQTSDRSWAETDQSALSNPQNVQFNEGTDVKGPLTLGVAIEQMPDPAAASAAAGEQSDQPKSRVVVFTTSRLATNEVFQLGANLGNTDLFINAASWAVGDDELISIRPREPENRTLFLTNAQKNFVMLSSILLLPAIVLGMGIIVWWSRR